MLNHRKRRERRVMAAARRKVKTKSICESNSYVEGLKRMLGDERDDCENDIVLSYTERRGRTDTGEGDKKGKKNVTWETLYSE